MPRFIPIVVLATSRLCIAKYSKGQTKRQAGENTHLRFRLLQSCNHGPLSLAGGVEAHGDRAFEDGNPSFRRRVGLEQLAGEDPECKEKSHIYRPSTPLSLAMETNLVCVAICVRSLASTHFMRHPSSLCKQPK